MAIFEGLVIEKIEKKDEATKENILIGPVTVTAKDIEQAKVKILWQYFLSLNDGLVSEVDISRIEVTTRPFRS